MSILGLPSLLLALTALVSAQTGSTSDKADAPKTKQTTKLVTLVGCVAGNPSAPREYTIVDKDSGTFRLTGTDMQNYVGREVEVSGGTKRFQVVGGLLPTPNAAAQAGAVDPTPAAAAPTAARGTAPPPEFRVKSVKTLKGTCLP
jgi:hypothetical protein